MAETTEYQQAKEIINDLELHNYMIINVNSGVNFRKYLCEIGKPTGKKYLTSLEGNEMFVIRVK